MRTIRVIAGCVALMSLIVGCDDGGTDDPSADARPDGDGPAPDTGMEGCLGEVCDGVDNDCDGTIDEGFAGLGEACEAGVGACLSAGVNVCAADGEGVTCDAIAGEGSDEVCDGVDNDCNGEADDGLPDGEACDTGEPGPCASGIQRCFDGSIICTPQIPASDEVCDGLDNDCDDATDEGEGGQPLSEACYTGPEGTEGVGDCRSGSRVCTDGQFGVCQGQLIPVEEVCDDADSDCDGAVDEALGLRNECTVGVGACAASGIQVCDPGTLGVMCDTPPGEPADETCNGIDDDCDGVLDEVAGVGEACEAGVGACRVLGGRVCAEGELVCDAVASAPGDELCNEIDDDCDGEVDNVAGVGERCVVGLGQCRAEGFGRCDVGAGEVVCDVEPGVPGPVEYCGDMADDDCDGAVDEEPCSRRCGEDQPCGAGEACIDGICGAAEVCDDGIDNDNDGAVDCLDDGCIVFEGCGPCGDRILDPDEACDDGNRAAGDGCAPDCTVEEGYLCAAPGFAECAEGDVAEALIVGDGQRIDPVGGDGGDPYDDSCPAGEVIIGFDAHIGDQWRFGNGATHLQRVRAQCAQLSLVDGDVVLTPTGPTPDRGGVAGSDVPAGFTDEQRCPAGQAVVGVSLFGAGQYPVGMTIACGTVEFDGGGVVGEPVDLPAAGPADVLAGATRCPEGAVAMASTGRAGHVLDQVGLRCAPLVGVCGTPSVCGIDRACRYAFDGPEFEPVFVTDGQAPWSIDADGVATSGDITHDQASNLRIAVSMPAGGTVSFRRRVSSEGCCDRLRFTVDGVQLADWRGEVEWAEERFELEPGDHVIQWAYTKDVSIDTGEDRAQIDDVAITGAAALCVEP